MKFTYIFEFLKDFDENLCMAFKKNMTFKSVLRITSLRGVLNLLTEYATLCKFNFHWL